MRVPFGLLLGCLAVSGLLFAGSGGQVTDLVLLGLVAALAALVLVLRARPAAPPARWIVVDGSNVMHWQGQGASLLTVTAVIDDLRQRGFVPLVGFDANVGYLVGQGYMGPHRLARALGLPEAQVFVAPKGTPADPLLLQRAEALQVPVVSNDRYRDWADRWPKVTEPGFLIRGEVDHGAVRLRLP